MDASNDFANVEILRNGGINPLTLIEPVCAARSGRFDGSVHYAGGDLCKTGFVNLLQHDWEPSPFDDKNASAFSGRHIFGGLLFNTHFGHFITESIGRLWAFDQLSAGFDSIVFYPLSRQLGIPGYAREFLDILCPGAAIRIATQPTTCEILAVPQALMKGRYVYGHPLVRENFKRLACGAIQPGKKIYVSRSQLSDGQGTILGESIIDRYLSEEGYEIIRPEQMSIKDQLLAYQTAEKIIFADGSALHLYALIPNLRQSVFVIWRRQKYTIFNWQVHTFGGPSLLGEPHLRELLVTKNRYPDTAHALALLDFESLHAQLRQYGFVAGPPWKARSKDAFNDELARYAARENSELILVPPPY